MCPERVVVEFNKIVCVEALCEMLSELLLLLLGSGMLPV